MMMVSCGLDVDSTAWACSAGCVVSSWSTEVRVVLAGLAAYREVEVVSYPEVEEVQAQVPALAPDEKRAPLSWP